jgi:hypothetical protein
MTGVGGVEVRKENEDSGIDGGIEREVRLKCLWDHGLRGKGLLWMMLVTRRSEGVQRGGSQ